MITQATLKGPDCSTMSPRLAISLTRKLAAQGRRVKLAGAGTHRSPWGHRTSASMAWTTRRTARVALCPWRVPAKAVASSSSTGTMFDMPDCQPAGWRALGKDAEQGISVDRRSRARTCANMLRSKAIRAWTIDAVPGELSHAAERCLRRLPRPETVTRNGVGSGGCAVDHCHETDGNPRSRSAIAVQHGASVFAKDDPARLACAADYLERHAIGFAERRPPEEQRLMAMTGVTGPIVSYGPLAGLPGSIGGGEQLAGPSLFYHGAGIPDPRFSFPKDQAGGFKGVAQSFLAQDTYRSAVGTPAAHLTNNIAATHVVVSGTAMTLAAPSFGASTNIPLVPIGASSNTAGANAVVTPGICLDFGFGLATLVSGSANVTFADTSVLIPGMPLIFAALATTTTPWLTTVASITSATVAVMTIECAVLSGNRRRACRHRQHLAAERGHVRCANGSASVSGQRPGAAP